MGWISAAILAGEGADRLAGSSGSEQPGNKTVNKAKSGSRPSMETPASDEIGNFTCRDKTVNFGLFLPENARFIAAFFEYKPI